MELGSEEDNDKGNVPGARRGEGREQERQGHAPWRESKLGPPS